MPQVEVVKTVPLSFEKTWDIVVDCESFPKFMESVESVEIMDRGDNWALVKWVTHLKGATFRWVEKDYHYPEEGRIAWNQTEGDLKVFDGEWRLKRVPEGTEVTLMLDFEFGIPMVSSLLNPVAKVMVKQNALSMLNGIAEKAQG